MAAGGARLKCYAPTNRQRTRAPKCPPVAASVDEYATPAPLLPPAPWRAYLVRAADLTDRISNIGKWGDWAELGRRVSSFASRTREFRMSAVYNRGHVRTDAIEATECVAPNCRGVVLEARRDELRRPGGTHRAHGGRGRPPPRLAHRGGVPRSPWSDQPHPWPKLDRD